jgi:uncharacterized protein YktA (UPF0223 family)
MKLKGLLVALGLLVGSSVFAGNGPTLFKEISRKAIIDLSSIELSEDVNFTNVIFKVRNNKIKIIEMEASSKELKQLVKERLEKIVLNQDYDQEQVYRYRFIFEKE